MPALGFTAIRLISGAIVLLLVVADQQRPRRGREAGGLAAACSPTRRSFFICLLVSLPTATGALLLFGAVQVHYDCLRVLGGERPA